MIIFKSTCRYVFLKGGKFWCLRWFWLWINIKSGKKNQVNSLPKHLQNVLKTVIKMHSLWSLSLLFFFYIAVHLNDIKDNISDVNWETFFYLQDVKSDGYPRSYPIGGLCYYLSPPKTTLQVTQDPVYALVYTVFMIGSCGLFSRIWIDLIMIGPVDVSHAGSKWSLKFIHYYKFGWWHST